MPFINSYYASWSTLHILSPDHKNHSSWWNHLPFIDGIHHNEHIQGALLITPFFLSLAYLSKWQYPLPCRSCKSGCHPRFSLLYPGLLPMNLCHFYLGPQTCTSLYYHFYQPSADPDGLLISCPSKWLLHTALEQSLQNTNHTGYLTTWHPSTAPIPSLILLPHLVWSPPHPLGPHHAGLLSGPGHGSPCRVFLCSFPCSKPSACLLLSRWLLLSFRFCHRSSQPPSLISTSAFSLPPRQLSMELESAF